MPEDEARAYPHEAGKHRRSAAEAAILHDIAEIKIAFGADEIVHGDFFRGKGRASRRSGNRQNAEHLCALPHHGGNFL
ncbi:MULTISPECIES: hypothetical protein [unclassified Rhizobium]|uniref:hypothetical protein n=1 Tax=unclassified Rhizobium TaxID=2613769 RepID=UPI0012E3A81D|nr:MULTISPECIES: hypothetical protein [unclassified Rhizobium]